MKHAPSSVASEEVRLPLDSFGIEARRGLLEVFLSMENLRVSLVLTGWMDRDFIDALGCASRSMMRGITRGGAIHGVISPT